MTSRRRRSFLLMLTFWLPMDLRQGTFLMIGMDAMGCGRRFGGFDQCFMCLGTCILPTGLLLSYDDAQKAFEAQHLRRISEARNQRKLQQAASGGRYIPPHLRSKQFGGSGATGSEQVPPAFPARDPLLEAPVLAQGQTLLINAAIKTSGTPRGAIVAKIP